MRYLGHRPQSAEKAVQKVKRDWMNDITMNYEK